MAHECFHILCRKKQGRDEFLTLKIDILNAYDCKKQGRDDFLALKTDILKAYDRIEWVFFGGYINKIGFCSVMN